METVNSYYLYLCDYLGRLNGYSKKRDLRKKDREGLGREILNVEKELIKLKNKS